MVRVDFRGVWHSITSSTTSSAGCTSTSTVVVHSPSKYGKGAAHLYSPANGVTAWIVDQRIAEDQAEAFREAGGMILQPE